MAVAFAPVPARVMINLSGRAESNQIAFESDRGPPITRAGSTRVLQVRDITFEPWTLAQYASFETWWETVLAGGAERFLLPDPMTKAEAEWAIPVGETYQFRTLTPARVQVSLRAIRVRYTASSSNELLAPVVVSVGSGQVTLTSQGTVPAPPPVPVVVSTGDGQVTITTG